jgi:hypothetical protein
VLEKDQSTFDRNNLYRFETQKKDPSNTTRIFKSSANPTTRKEAHACISQSSITSCWIRHVAKLSLSER